MTRPEARVVLLCGISGSGKTHRARQLEADGYVRLSSDALLWEQYGDAFPQLSPGLRAKAFGELGERLARRLDDLLQTGAAVAVDAPLCKRSQRDRLRGVCARHGASALTVFMDAAPDVLKRRLAARRGQGPDDQIVSAGQVESYYAGFERPDADEQAVVVPQS